MTGPGTFTTVHIAITAVITAAVGLPLAWWRLRPTYPGEAIVLAALTGAAVFAWRLSANMPQLNNDGIPPFSANDWAARSWPTLHWAATPACARQPITPGSVKSAQH
jgi:MFS superfamily sulfate permease-like transporter